MAFPLIRYSVELALIGRVGKVYEAVGLQSVVNYSTDFVMGWMVGQYPTRYYFLPNPDLDGPILDGLASLGFAPAVWPVVNDGDLAAITPGSASCAQLVDVAELSARRKALDAYLDVDQQVDRDRQSCDQLAQRWQKRIDALAAYCRSTYGLGLGSVQAGSIDLGFQETPGPWGCL